MTTSDPGSGITHSGPEPLNISGAAIGAQGTDRPGPAARPDPELSSGPSVRNDGVLNLGLGQINMQNCVTGPGATLSISQGAPEPEPEPEAGL